MNELMNVTKVAELANKDLKKNCTAILKELTKVNKSAWTIAHKYKEIVTGEQYKDDFESFSEFADFVGVNRTTLNLYSKTAMLSDTITTNLENFSTLENDVTMSKIIEILPLFKSIDNLDVDLIIDTFCGVIDEMGGYDVFKNMNNKEVRDYIKFYINEHEEVEEEVEEEHEEVEEEQAEVEEEQAEVEEETIEPYNEILLEDYILTADNVSDFNKTIANFIKQGITLFHITVRK